MPFRILFLKWTLKITAIICIFIAHDIFKRQHQWANAAISGRTPVDLSKSRCK